MCRKKRKKVRNRKKKRPTSGGCFIHWSQTPQKNVNFFFKNRLPATSRSAGDAGPLCRRRRWFWFIFGLFLLFFFLSKPSKITRARPGRLLVSIHRALFFFVFFLNLHEIYRPTELQRQKIDCLCVCVCVETCFVASLIFCLDLFGALVGRFGKLPWIPSRTARYLDGHLWNPLNPTSGLIQVSGILLDQCGMYVKIYFFEASLESLKHPSPALDRARVEHPWSGVGILSSIFGILMDRWQIYVYFFKASLESLKHPSPALDRARVEHPWNGTGILSSIFGILRTWSVVSRVENLLLLLLL